MASLDPFGYGTHEVLNQAPAMADYDAYSHDPALGKILSIFDAEWAAPHAGAVGKRVGSARVQELARRAQRSAAEIRVRESAESHKPASGLETLEEVQRLLRRLPTREREVVRLFYLEGRSYEEISTALHLPVNSIGPVLSRVKKKLANGRARTNSEPKDAATDGKQSQ